MSNEVMEMPRTEIVPSERFRNIALRMAEYAPARGDWVHTFTKGADGKTNLLSRQMTLYKGDYWMSKIHKVQSPFVILSGEVLIESPDGSQEIITGPHFGVTEPGTQRLIYVRETTVWIAFHATNKTDIAEIEEEVILKQDDPRLTAPNAYPQALPSPNPVG